MARVYAGVEEATGRAVAIKVLREGHSPEHRTVERFIAEVRAVKQIRHRNIIDIYGFGALPDGRPYFVMEYRPGMTLQQRIDRDGPLTFLEAAPIFSQACSALQAAHDRGIVHRDLKPDNIYLADEPGGPPVVKLLDFGIAKLVTQEASAALTQVGATVGTPLYMSPEQIRALPLDARSDVYTLGVTLFQALTGEVPFFANSHAQTATMHLSQPPPKPSEVCDLLPIPERVDQIVLRCLEKNPQARYASMDELRAAIESAAGELMSARQLSGSRELRPQLPSIPPLPPSASSQPQPTARTPRPAVDYAPLVADDTPASARMATQPLQAAARAAPPAAALSEAATVQTQAVTAPVRTVSPSPEAVTVQAQAVRPPAPQDVVATQPLLRTPAPGVRPGRTRTAPARRVWIPSTQLLLWLLVLIVVLLAVALAQVYLGVSR